MINDIAVVRLSALGDVLMMVPLIRTLQKHLPSANITWIISKPAYFLVEGMDGVEFIVIDKPKTVKDYWRFKKQMDEYQFDLLLAPQASLRTNLLYPLIKAKRKIGYDRARAKDAHSFFVGEQIKGGNEHTLEGFLKFAQVLGLGEPDIRWDLPINPEDEAWAIEHMPKGSPVLVVNPAASKAERNWPVDRLAIVLLRVKQRYGVEIVLTGGPGPEDRRLADELLQQIPATDLVGKTKPKQLLAVIARAAAVLCPDTGPAHMAAAVNTPVVALHAVTNPEISGPYPFRHYAVNRYPDAVKQLLKLPRNEVSWGTQVRHPEAMSLIQVDEVLKQLDRVFYDVGIAGGAIESD